MAQKKAHEVDSFLSRLQTQYPIVLVYGPDRGLVAERAAKFAKLTGIKLDDPFSNIRLDAGDLERDPIRLVDETGTVSLFGGKRLIWVRNAANGKNLANAVKQLAKTRLENVYLLIEAGDLKKGTALRTAIETAPSAIALPCYADDGRALDGLIDQVLGEYQLAISLDARKWLKDSLGGDRLVSRSELDKLCLYAMGRKEVTLDDVKNAVSDVSGLTYDEIIDAVLVGDLVGFNNRFDRQVATGSALFLIISAAQRQFQQLQLLRQQVEVEGKTLSSVIASARPPIFFRRQKIIELAISRWTLNRIAQAMQRLQKTVLESRQNALLAEPIIRQALLALAVSAKQQTN
ncbi:DNA polymerase III subunit delta [uncultured Bartonella sp.]|uniref:DNA polymerase III subunit delta n=1 Tax=uncultured Bartonella sp. TaxID=104108 RepID=UPI00261A5C9B|nr:DNA polymerase III subunit delta [uncultured Bartonella sp.]